jgi:hypothetical protein
MRRAPRNLRIACDHRGLTHYGGAYFFHEFLQVLQVRDFLAGHLAYPDAISGIVCPKCYWLWSTP